MPCSVCHESGHNKVTCKKNASLGYSTSKTNQVKAHEKFGGTFAKTQNPVSSKLNVAPSGISAKSDLCSAGNGLKYAESKIKTSASSKTVAYLELTSISEGLKNLKITSTETTVTTITTVEGPECSNTLHKKSHDSSKFSNVQGDGKTKNCVLNSKVVILPDNQVIINGKVCHLNPWRTIKINEADKNILDEKCLKRFHQGPTTDDGPGYIYMYKLNGDVGQDNMFKIGCSQNLPRRRVHIQEVRNKEIYDVVYTKDVNYRKLAELIIHLRLKNKGKQSRRDVVDGGTEWFKGTKADLVFEINDVIRFIHHYAISPNT